MDAHEVLGIEARLDLAEGAVQMECPPSRDRVDPAWSGIDVNHLGNGEGNLSLSLSSEQSLDETPAPARPASGTCSSGGSPLPHQADADPVQGLQEPLPAKGLQEIIHGTQIERRDRVLVERCGKDHRRPVLGRLQDFDTGQTRHAHVHEHQVRLELLDETEGFPAAPLGMQDFRPSDGFYLYEPVSEHPAYPFEMTARDMARLGLLMARNGVWRGEQLVPSDWVARSTQPYSDAGGVWSYGYMWWVGKAEALEGHPLIAALGGSGQAIYVVPDLDLVVVHRVDAATFQYGWDEVYTLLRRIFNARG